MRNRLSVVPEEARSLEKKLGPATCPHHLGVEYQQVFDCPVCFSNRAAGIPAPVAPTPAREYPHLLVCSGDRSVPAGTPGHSCCCLNVANDTQAHVLAARGLLESLACRECEDYYPYGENVALGTPPSERCAKSKSPCLVCRARTYLATSKGD